jgi:hypothetical protein
MGIFNEFHKKEKPVFTGVTRGVGGFAFGTSGLTVSSTFAATGGVITPGSVTPNGYTYHIFDTANSPETFDVTSAGDSQGYIEVLVVGGGGGGADRGGGGGAGGVRHLTYQVTGTATMPVSVGAGGAGGSTSNADGTTGGNTVFVNPLEPETTTCGGGGGGGGGGRTGLSNTNGSSGGVGRDGNTGPVAAPNTAFGYPSGGAAANNNCGAGGGGGATGSGQRGNGPTTQAEGPGAGGYGVAYPGFGGPLISPPGSPNPRVPSPVRTAITTAGFYGAGGGGGSGGSTTDPTASFSRMGIGGIGQRIDDAGPGPTGTEVAVDLTGSGGGGGGDGSPGNGGSGGDGVVIVRYRKRGDGSDDVGTVSGPDGSRNVKAVGGVIEFTSTTTLHYFLQPGTFTVNTAITGAKVLVVGGGGSGADRHGGGGGAGGVVYGPSVSIPAATYPVVIGAGGVQSSQGVNQIGQDGIDSSFGPPASVAVPTHFQSPGGGGGGGYAPAPTTGRAGGSGGGGGGQTPAPGGASSPGFTPSGSPHPLPFGTVIRYGSAGGAGNSGSPDFRNGGGGGGATGAGGGPAPGPDPAGNGGNGFAVSFGGNPYTFAGGGGGGRWNSYPVSTYGGTGGPGGGGAGGSNGPGQETGSGDPIIPGGPGHWLAPHFPGPSQNGGGQKGSPSRGGDAVFGTGGGGGGQGQGLPFTPTYPTGTAGSGAPGIVIIEYPS